MPDEIVYNPVGFVRSPFKSSKGTPIQPKEAKGVKAQVFVKKEYSEGLKDLEGFSHIILICHLHLSKGYNLKVRPFMDDNLRGVFSTRAPKRPNSIGLSTVKLNKVEGNILFVEEIDILDGTPVLDIKPYVPEFDRREAERIGWLKNVIHKLPEKKDNGRFLKE